MERLMRLLVLPPEITAFERSYLGRVNRVVLLFFLAHLPVFTLFAWFNHTGPARTAAFTALALVGPLLACAACANPRTISIVHGVTAMFMGGILVSLGEGPMQIEMHFYFFALLAICSVFANPMVIIAATVTVTLHHLIMFAVLPRAIFNYDGTWWVVAVHAAFVVLEAVASCFMARSFFDRVIGLDRIVQTRTAALDAKNREMRLLLDSVQQGFLTIDRSGKLVGERSAPIDRWFGVPKAGSSWFECLAQISRKFERSTRVAWTEVVEGIMPLELTIAQMPQRLVFGKATFDVSYAPIGKQEPHERFLIIITEVSSIIAREAAEVDRRDMMALFENMLADRSGIEIFLGEGATTIDALDKRTGELVSARRLLHTLKGNAALLGIVGIAQGCHQVEDWMAANDEWPPADVTEALVTHWLALASAADRMFGRVRGGLLIDERLLTRLEEALRRGDSTEMLLRRVDAFRLEPTGRRLDHIAEQARQTATRLGKQNVFVRIEHNGVRLDAHRWASFWSSFVHAIRNALDHGMETAEDRIALGKPEEATLTLRTQVEGDKLVIEVEDDGRGVDWDSVRRRAQKMGLPHETHEDLQAALFADGLSTTTEVTEISGRGVGMAALLAATEALEGSIEVRSQPGRGTVISMGFPNKTALVSLAALPKQYGGSRAH